MPGHPWFEADRAPGPRPQSPPSGGVNLVLAPHPDDEILGAAGSLALAVEEDRSTTIRVVHLTAGERGHPDAAPDPELGRRRLAEAAEALAALGLPAGRSLGLPDGGIEADPEAIAFVAEELAAAGRLFVPSPFDPHPDHRATARIAAAALVGGASEATVWIYEVQPAGPVDALVRIDAVLDLKERALAAHASQNEGRRLVAAGLGLAACRALYAPGDWRAAEAFRIAPAAVFVDYCRAAGWRGNGRAV